MQWGICKNLSRTSKLVYEIVGELHIRGDVNKGKLMKLRVSFIDKYNIKSISCVDGAHLQ